MVLDHAYDARAGGNSVNVNRSDNIAGACFDRGC